MSSKLFLIFNHNFTPSQEADARASLGVGKIETMPEPIKQIWSSIPPDLPGINAYLEPVRQWLSDSAEPSDYVLIQGDFGACYLMVCFAFEHGLIPVYSTTKREAVEEHQADGSVKLTHHFNHQIFRKYGG